MNILEKLSNFKNSFEGGAPNNGFTNETLRDAVGLWVNDREEAFSLYGDINTYLLVLLIPKGAKLTRLLLLTVLIIVSIIIFLLGYF